MALFLQSCNLIPDHTGMADKRVLIIWNGTAGAGRQYVAAAMYLQEMGMTVSMVGPPDSNQLAKHFNLAYVCTSPSTQELLSRPSVVQACTANDYEAFERAFALENEAYTAGNIHVICQAIKGFEPELILVSTRLLHRVLTAGNALGIPVLPLALQEPNDVLGDALEPAWATMKDSKIASLLTGELESWGSSFEQALGVSPAAHFWPSVSQVQALVGKAPQFPYLTLVNFDMLDIKVFNEIKGSSGAQVIGQVREPETLPWSGEKKPRPTKVYALGRIQLDTLQETYLPALYDRTEAQKLEEFIVRYQDGRNMSFCTDKILVYVSYGPVICRDVKFMTGLVLRALMKVGFQAIVDASCGMSMDQLSGEPDAGSLKEYIEENVFFVHKVPCTKFLSRCIFCLHDGNSSMIQRSLEMRTPSIITPIFGQQFENARRVADIDFGLVLPGMTSLSVDSFAAEMSTLKTIVRHKKISDSIIYPSLRHPLHDLTARVRFPNLLRQIWTENIQDNKLLKDMDDIKADNGSCARCCTTRRVQP